MFHELSYFQTVLKDKQAFVNIILCLKFVVNKKTGLLYRQAALVIRGGYVPRKYREYQNREYQVQ